MSKMRSWMIYIAFAAAGIAAGCGGELSESGADLTRSEAARIQELPQDLHKGNEPAQAPVAVKYVIDARGSVQTVAAAGLQPEAPEAASPSQTPGAVRRDP